MSRRSVSKVVHCYQQYGMAEPRKPWPISANGEAQRQAKLSKPLETVYLLFLPFSFNLFRFEAETNHFASLLTSHTISSISIQNNQVKILTISKALLDPLQC